MNELTKQYLKQLVGKKITKADVSKDVSPYITIQITLDDGTVLKISSDEEGNGAGFIFGLPQCK
jgi:hypothetical protein